MKISGIICEYNPFHNGHKLQIEEAKSRTGCDAVVALMSGNYVQRGDVAIFDKFTRANCAIAGGADLVLELPTTFSMQSAEFFAKNSVYILNSLGVTDYLAFGAETDNIKLFDSISALLANETEEFKQIIASKLDMGHTFAKARAEAVKEILGAEAEEIISMPNNILAIEYMKSLKQMNSNIKPLLIKRQFVGHDSLKSSNNFASATQIRNLIKDESFGEAFEFIPSECHDIIIGAKTTFISEFSKAIMCELHRQNADYLKNIADVGEGLENRIKRALETASDLAELITAVKTKRYTESRIRRVMLNSFLGITKEMQSETPEYVRVLDFNETGRSVLNLAKKGSDIPIIKNTSQVKKMKNEKIAKQWFRELMFDKMYMV